MLTKSSLSIAEKRLLETMQRINFGRVEKLNVVGGEPVMAPSPRIVKDVKLGAPDNGSRPELDTTDFALKREHIELFESLRSLCNGTIECIEIKAGLPFRLITVEDQM